jgi:regulator of nucleoside diphosphate kinase
MKDMVKDMTHSLDTKLPPISMNPADIERLRKLADAAANKYPETSDFLAREIERAAVLPEATPCAGLVTMESSVTFRDDVSSQTRSVRLVYPEDADVDAGKISILTPIGAALIGLSEGQTIEFQTPAGGWRALTVLTVKPQAD